MDSVACHMPRATKTPKTMPKFCKHAAARPANLVFHFIQFERAPNKATTTTTRSGKQQWQHLLRLRRQTLRLFMSQPHVASSTTENDNEAAVDTCCHLLATLVVSAASVICIKWQQLVGAPHWECHAPFFHSSAACETMHINHDDGNSSSSSTCCSTLG